MKVMENAMAAFSVVVCEAKSEIMCLQTNDGGKLRSPSPQPASRTNKHSSVCI